MAKRKSSLVCQYLEKMSRTMLEQYQDVIRQQVKKSRHGIYALYRGDRLYYVGLATSLLQRLKQHLHDRHKHTWDRFSIYLTLDATYMKEIESLLLRITNPPGNKVRGKFAAAQDLRPVIRKAYSELRRQEEQAMFGDEPKLKSKSAGGKAKGRTAKPKVEKPSEEGSEPALAKYVGRVRCLRATYKGKTYSAIILKDGMIRLAGKRYKSPSGAGKAVTKRAVDGWHFWSYERAPKDWVKIDELRQ